RTEGVVVSPVYTAKGLAGMVDFVRTGRIAAGSTVVFVHTGGLTETFAYNEEVYRAAAGG
ncbi:MAG TPA: D-cysteine desulfhydrase family protein, partial [Phycisphaerae bacterium]|nr:D-cysteine desulfhydrase family protein [Phycisphaerae bacterium]